MLEAALLQCSTIDWASSLCTWPLNTTTVLEQDCSVQTNLTLCR
jgi:hypothetical protein